MGLIQGSTGRDRGTLFPVIMPTIEMWQPPIKVLQVFHVYCKHYRTQREHGSCIPSSLSANMV